MLSRSAIVARTCAVLAKQRGGVRLLSDHAAHAHGDAHYGDRPPVPSMNDLPVPSGSWQQAHTAKQTKFNIYLAASIIFFFSTFGYVYQAKIVDLNLPPKMKN